MLKINKTMLDTAGKLMNSRKNHVNDGKYDYYTTDHQSVAVVKGAGSTRKVGQFHCDDFVIIDSYDFN